MSPQPQVVAALFVAACPWLFLPGSSATDRDAPASPLATPQAKGLSWFDQKTPCPECGHTSWDHCVCIDSDDNELIDPPCPCGNEAHFSGAIRPPKVES